jgi:thymidylate synthase ThyX
MKILKQSSSVLALSEHNGFPFDYKNSMFLQEYSGRLCYKSEESITKTSHVNFLNNIKEMKHLSVLEHSWKKVLYKIRVDKISTYYSYVNKACYPHLNFYIGYENDYLYVVVTGNERAYDDWLEKTHFDDGLQIMNANLNVTKLAKKTNRYDLLSMTSHFVTNRAIANELVRHRMASYSQESTRYCNYNSMRFDKSCSFIEPINGITNEWEETMKTCEKNYLSLVDNGIKPEVARGLLPMDLKTEIIMTANLKSWKHVFDQRYHNQTGKSHPQFTELLELLINDIKKRDNTEWLVDYLLNKGEK